MINIYIFFSFTLTWPQSSWGREGSQQSHQKSQLLPAGHISLSPRVTGEVTLNFNNQQQMIRHGATRQERWRDGAFWPRLWCLWFVLGPQQSNVPAAFLFSFLKSQVSGDTDNKTWDVGQESPFIGPNKSDLCEGSVVSVGRDSRRLESPLMEIWVKLFYFIGKSGTLRLDGVCSQWTGVLVWFDFSGSGLLSTKFARILNRSWFTINRSFIVTHMLLWYFIYW